MEYPGGVVYAFIDESEHQDQYFFLTALIVREENLPALEHDLRNLVTTYALTTDTPVNGELHGYDLMQQKGDWEGVKFGIAKSIYIKAMGIINQHAAALYIETFDRDAQRRKYKRLYNHRTLTIGYLLECVNDFARREGRIATAYLDDHYTAPEGRKEFIHYKSEGTFGYKSSKLAHINELDFFDSREMLGLQAADLCCYIYQRIVTANGANPRTVALQNKMWGAVSDIAANGRQRTWPINPRRT